MAFQYDPKDASDCVPAGDYEAEITTAEEMVSKEKQNSMLKITFTVPYNGKNFKVIDYIVNPTGIWKLKKIAKALGAGAEFEAGTFDLTEYVGKAILLHLEVELSDKFGDKNTVKGYAEARFEPAALAHEQVAPGEEIPF